MKLHLTQSEGNQLITGSGDGWIAVNHQRHHGSLIVMPDKLLPDWTIRDFEALSIENFVEIAALNPEVLLLGTGKTHRFVHPKLTVPLTEKNIAVECMTTDAACRTYNILMAEGRQVAAALIV